MNQVTQSRPARAAAVAKQEEAIDQNIVRIEEQRRRPPSALALMASRLGVSESNLSNTLKATVFKNCSDAEFVALVIVANEYKLNPLTKEIYAFAAKGGGIVPLVSIDGWVRIMNEHPQYDGIEFNDIVDESGKLYAIESIIWRKDRTRPIKVVEYMDECRRKSDPWDKSPNRMLRHRSLIQGARYAFGFSGIYADDEAEIQIIGDPVQARNVTPPTRQETATIGHDPETGEIIDEEDLARTLDAETGGWQEGPSETDRGERFNQDDDTPLAVTTAARIKALFTDAPDKPAYMEALAMWNKNKGQIEAYDASLAADVFTAEQKAKQRLGVE